MEMWSPFPLVFSTLCTLGCGQLESDVSKLANETRGSAKAADFSHESRVSEHARDTNRTPAMTPKVRALVDQTLSRDPDTRAAAARELALMGNPAKPAAPFLVRLLADRASVTDKVSAWQWAYFGLKEMGDPAVDPLIDALKHKNPERRRMAVRLLASIGDARAVENLIACLNEPDWQIQSASIRGLHRLGDDRAINPLVACMNDRRNRDSIRHRAAQALGVFREARVAKALSAVLKDDEEPRYIRYYAAAALGNMGGSAARETLLAMTAHRDVIVREGVFWGLVNIADSDVVSRQMQAIKDTREPLRVRCASAIGLGHSKDPKAIEYLLAVVDDESEDIQVRKSALAGLSLSEDSRAEKRVFAALKSEPVSLAYVAVLVMRHIESPATGTAFVAGLEHDDSGIRRLAADALGEREELGAIRALKGRLDDECIFAAYSVKRAVAKIEGIQWIDLDESRKGISTVFELDDATMWSDLFGPLSEPPFKLRLRRSDPANL